MDAKCPVGLEVFDNIQALRTQLKTQEKLLVDERNTTSDKVSSANTKADEAWSRVEKERLLIRDFNESDGRNYKVLLQQNKILERQVELHKAGAKTLSTALAAAKDATYIQDIEERQTEDELEKAKLALAAAELKIANVKKSAVRSRRPVRLKSIAHVT